MIVPGPARARHLTNSNVTSSGVTTWPSFLKSLSSIFRTNFLTFYAHMQSPKDSATPHKAAYYNHSMLWQQASFSPQSVYHGNNIPPLCLQIHHSCKQRRASHAHPHCSPWWYRLVRWCNQCARGRYGQGIMPNAGIASKFAQNLPQICTLALNLLQLNSNIWHIWNLLLLKYRIYVYSNIHMYIWIYMVILWPNIEYRPTATADPWIQNSRLLPTHNFEYTLSHLYSNLQAVPFILYQK